jgi:hypothetical protein
VTELKDRTEEALIDLYDDKPKSKDQEVEELKEIAKGDALRFYARLRTYVIKLNRQIGPRLEAIKPVIQTLRKRVAKVDLNRQKIAVIGGVAVVMLAGLGLASQLLFRGDTADTTEVLGQQTPELPSVVPRPATVDEETDIIVDEELGIATYRLVYEGVAITVTVQALPEGFAEDLINKTRELALSLQNKTTIDQIETDKGVAYVTRGELEERVITAFDNVLVFLTTAQSLINEDWTVVINELQ